MHDCLKGPRATRWRRRLPDPASIPAINPINYAGDAWNPGNTRITTGRATGLLPLIRRTIQTTAAGFISRRDKSSPPHRDIPKNATQ